MAKIDEKKGTNEPLREQKLFALRCGIYRDLSHNKRSCSQVQNNRKKARWRKVM